MVLIDWLVAALAVYVAIGVGFAVAFVTFGVQRIDAAARGSGWAFRLLISPGSAALWPLMLSRWVRGMKPHEAASG